MPCSAELEEGLTARELVAVKEDLLLPLYVRGLRGIKIRGITWLSAHQWVLSLLAIAHIISIRPIRGGHR